MIKALGRGAGGRPIVILGLSRENCERLLEGQPIPVDCGPFGIECTVVLCAGETEQAIVDELQKHVRVQSGQSSVATDEGG